jgi:hypothetical protein
VEVEGGKGDLPAEGSFVTAPGVMTTLKKSFDEKSTVMRLYNNTSKTVDCDVGGILGLKPQCLFDLEENKLSDSPGKLGPYEVKTLKMS